MKKLYVNEEIKVSEGDLANELLQINNDLPFFDSSEKGIHKVPKDRWIKAQKYEKKTWMNNFGAKDDRNYEHLNRFENMQSLKNLKLENTSVIELGCGPFTNLRLLTNVLTPKKITLLDPLISDYLNHPNCTYKTGKLNDISVTTIKSPIENFETSEKFDVVIMINVIEHCFDVDSIFTKIKSILNKDGVFIFSDVYFRDVHTLASNIYDAGHPLRLSEEKLNSFLEEFDVIFDKRFQGLYFQEWRNDVYFIGKKK